ncbi:MAG: hypothetical protein LW699_12120 [Pirellula sp.]|nr:hypothetical protein [Pirellula sp.]
MSSGNRTVKYENLLKALRKHYKPLADPPERSVLEHLLYACCLEDARVEQADEGFAKLQQTYFDWNEVRVTTVAELAEALKALPFPMQAASRIKQCLQSIFETRYQYDIDDMKKANLGKATAELEAWKGMSPFAVAYVSQHALGGHSIPPSSLICDAMWQCEILTLQEIPKNALPGIERAIPKTKGIEFAGLMHQFATDLYHHPKSAAPLAVLKDMGASYKSKPKPIEEPKESKSKGSAAKQLPAKSTPPEKAPALKAPAESAKEPASKPTTVPAPKVAPSAVASAKSSSGQKTEKTEKVEPTKTASKQEVKEVKEVKAAKPPSKPLAAHVSKAIGKPAKASESVQGSGKSAASKPAGDKPTSEKSANGKPANGKPASGKPASGKPASGKPANGKPASSKPANGKPASGKSASPKPSSGKPVVSSKSADSKSSGSKPASSKPEKSSKPGKAAADQGKSDKGKIDKGKMDPSKGSKKDVKDSGKSSSKGNQGSVGSSLTKKKPK